MTTFTRSDDLRGAEFVDADLRGARFVGADLSGVVMRGVDVAGGEIDAPWLLEGERLLRAYGGDVAPLVEAGPNPRLPSRARPRVGRRGGVQGGRRLDLVHAQPGVVDRVHGGHRVGERHGQVAGVQAQADELRVDATGEPADGVGDGVRSRWSQLTPAVRRRRSG